jgi:hypothetical protein
MANEQNRGLKVVYLLLGIVVPLAGIALWTRGFGCWCGKKQPDAETAYDHTVEESFPASDPPAAW